MHPDDARLVADLWSQLWYQFRQDFGPAHGTRDEGQSLARALTLALQGALQAEGFHWYDGRHVRRETARRSYIEASFREWGRGWLEVIITSPVVAGCERGGYLMRLRTERDEYRSFEPSYDRRLAQPSSPRAHDELLRRAQDLGFLDENSSSSELNWLAAQTGIPARPTWSSSPLRQALDPAIRAARSISSAVALRWAAALSLDGNEVVLRTRTDSHTVVCRHHGPSTNFLVKYVEHLDGRLVDYRVFDQPRQLVEKARHACPKCWTPFHEAQARLWNQRREMQAYWTEYLLGLIRFIGWLWCENMSDAEKRFAQLDYSPSRVVVHEEEPYERQLELT